MINAINSEEDTLSLQKEKCLIKIKSVYDLNKENNDNMREELSTDDDFEIKQEAFDAIESEESQNEEIDEDFSKLTIINILRLLLFIKYFNRI